MSPAFPPNSGQFANTRSPIGAVAGVWLLHDRIDEAHQVAQDLDTPEGSFWHGIVHRREPDPGNAAYWFRRTGRHPVFPDLRQAVAAIEQQYPGIQLRLPTHWDPFRWIDLWEETRVQPDSTLYRVALDIQRAEWQVLFDYCTQPLH